jgi:tRNA(fMet)-specific endonuclease VapC
MENHIYLLDTNFVVALLRGDEGAVRFCRHHPMRSLHLCSIVEAELIYGAFNSQHVADNLNRLKEFSRFHSWEFDSDCALIYGRVRAQLKQKGALIGPNDLLIAAVALKYGATIVTRNLTELSNVSDLSLIGY